MTAPVALAYVHRSSLAYGNENDFHLRLLPARRDNNLGWARIHINGASGDKQLMPDENRDLCEICWSPFRL
jgi:hypothetical protein